MHFYLLKGFFSLKNAILFKTQIETKEFNRNCERKEECFRSRYFSFKYATFEKLSEKFLNCLDTNKLETCEKYSLD